MNRSGALKNPEWILKHPDYMSKKHLNGFFRLLAGLLLMGLFFSNLGCASPPGSEEAPPDETVKPEVEEEEENMANVPEQNESHAPGPPLDQELPRELATATLALG